MTSFFLGMGAFMVRLAALSIGLLVAFEFGLADTPDFPFFAGKVKVASFVLFDKSFAV
jgi:hypothetical protein